MTIREVFVGRAVLLAACAGGFGPSSSDQADLSGLGVRGSIAPIGQLSVDLAHSWLSGTITVADESEGYTDQLVSTMY